MKAEIDHKGALVIIPESLTEAYAVYWWYKNNHDALMRDSVSVTPFELPEGARLMYVSSPVVETVKGR